MAKMPDQLSVVYGGKSVVLYASVVPDGYCRCGCGQVTSIAQRNEYRRGHLKGQPVPYISGHGKRRRVPPYRFEERGYYSPCWVWQWNVGREGYGHVMIDRKQLLAHRLIYETLRGPIPPGFHLDHLCRVRCCVNPDHLEPVTPAENARRGDGTLITPDVADEIRRAEGVPYRVLAERFGISIVEVCCIRRGYRWQK